MEYNLHCILEQRYGRRRNRGNLGGGECNGHKISRDGGGGQGNGNGIGGRNGQPPKEDSDREETFVFPIVETPRDEFWMENIPPFVLPTLYGRVIEDPDSFLFEFDILCCNYAYNTDVQKLHLFPATLKGVALRLFMGLGEGTISFWDDMKKYFLKKYQAYKKTRESQEDIFKWCNKKTKA